MWHRNPAAAIGSAHGAPLIALAVLAGCATPQAWPPHVERLPEGAAGPVAPMKQGPLTGPEIVALARDGTPSGFIIQRLRDTRTPPMTAQETASLALQGVPSDVLAYLQYGERGIAPPPVYVPAPYYGWGPYSGYPYGWYSPWRYGPGANVYFGFGRRW